MTSKTSKDFDSYAEDLFNPDWKREDELKLFAGYCEDIHAQIHFDQMDIWFSYDKSVEDLQTYLESNYDNLMWKDLSYTTLYTEYWTWVIRMARNIMGTEPYGLSFRVSILAQNVEKNWAYDKVERFKFAANELAHVILARESWAFLEAMPDPYDNK